MPPAVVSPRQSGASYPIPLELCGPTPFAAGDAA